MNDFLFTYSPELKNKIYRFALSILGNEEDAKDTVQDAFERMWKKRFVFRIYQSKEALLFKLTRDLCLDRLKHLKIKETKLSAFSIYAEETLEIERKIEEGELFELIRILMMKLPLKQRMIMQLRDIEEMEYDEIARILDMDINAIRMNLSRARKSIGDQINKLMEYGTGKDKRNSIQVL